jgi:hypothetical protein
MKRTFPDRSAIVGVGAAIILAIVTGFVSNPTRSVVLAVAIGLAGTVLSLQINVVAKLDRSSDLDRALRSVAWLRPLLLTIAESAAAIETDERLEPFRPNAKKDVQQCVTNLQGISHGQLRARVGEGILERRTDQARRSIIATSIQQMDVPRWQSDLGEKYWQANINAIKRGVVIERVFVYREWSQELQKLVCEQARQGVQTHAVDRELVPAELMIDMAVWDDAFTYQFELNSEGDPINNLYSVNEVDIARRVEQFEILRSLAKRIEPPKTTGGKTRSRLRTMFQALTRQRSGESTSDG